MPVVWCFALLLSITKGAAASGGATVRDVIDRLPSAPQCPGGAVRCPAFLPLRTRASRRAKSTHRSSVRGLRRRVQRPG
ncbi:uncharacterized protein J3D65DRAFT_630964 [Phyllosticta citribraziliensis]|uniref:Secreted protein n=1 Tax=Phyllosticta citribraziliensis TaxID=989973 RepID=A0ABR1LJK1_9PEZI